jgi:hypothetical protein
MLLTTFISLLAGAALALPADPVATTPAAGAPTTSVSLRSSDFGLGTSSVSLPSSGFRLPASALDEADPADSLFRAARDAMSKGDYKKAADLFRDLRKRYPKSDRVSEALYYEAFSLYRRGESGDLNRALGALDALKASYPSVASKGDANSLRTRICGELAKRGDSDCAEQITERANDDKRRASKGSGDCPSGDEDDDERVIALNALLQMDGERALPILEKVLARRDKCSERLRRKAVFLVSQKNTPATADILMKAAHDDPDSEVREQAVFWLSQVHDERVVDMLNTILADAKDQALQEKAIFALSQNRSAKAGAALRAYAEREDAPSELREKAIFWLGQNRSSANAEYLRTLYAKIKNDDLKEKIIFSLSQQRGMNDKWLLDIVMNPKESVELRKKALFWAGQGGADMTQLNGLYQSINDREMKEQLIFVYSQRREAAAVDKLLEIAKGEKDRELRKKAIFWLSQSRDPRVVQFLQELIDR